MDIIEMNSYFFYIVNRDLDVVCTCVTHATEEGDPACKICLGTGYKITIRRVRGAAQEGKLPTSVRSTKMVVVRDFYIKSSIPIGQDDLIVDDGIVYVMFECQKLLSLEGTIPYKQALTLKKKYDPKLFMANFNEIVGGKR